MVYKTFHENLNHSTQTIHLTGGGRSVEAADFVVGGLS